MTRGIWLRIVVYVLKNLVAVAKTEVDNPFEYSNCDLMVKI